MGATDSPEAPAAKLAGDRDLNKQRQVEEALRTSAEYFRTAFENAPIGMALVSPDLRYKKVNRAFCHILGYAEAELLALGPAGISHPDDWHLQRQQVEPDEGNRGFLELEKRCIHKQGHVVWVQMTSSLVKDGRGRPVVFISQYQDITQRKRFEVELVHLANHDPLTDLFNRRRFQEEVEHHLALARRYGHGGALVFLDLDDFKDVNDRLGHRAGDEVLVTVAHCLRAQVRGADVLARLGGDEFALLLLQTDAHSAQVAVGRMLESLRAQALVGFGQPVRVTASVGVVRFPEHGITSEELLPRADLAMYRAKEIGGNCFVSFAPDLDWHQQITARQNWEVRIRDALEQGRFTLFAQPIWDLRRNRISQYELLLRMIDDNGELVLPGRFLDLAEHSGLIWEIDRWVVRRAIRYLANPTLLDPELHLGVNLSGRAFADPELLPLIQHELQAGGVAPVRLEIEITETAAIRNIHEARRFVDTLRGMGCRFALDDFGIGYSSFSHLKHLPVDFLKIDGSFVRDLCDNTIDQHLVRAMVEVARGLNKRTIAEFVQDQETMDLLRKLGVDYAQGFYIGIPRPLFGAAADV